MFKTTLIICALLLRLSLESINVESSCPYRAPVTVITEANDQMSHLSVNFHLNMANKWRLFNKLGNNNITLGTIFEESTLSHPVNFKDLPRSYYFSAVVVKDPIKQCDLKLAIVFTNNPSSTGNSISMEHFRSTPCVSIESLTCKKPTLSISYNGIVHESDSSDNTITYSGATLVYCNGPSDNHFKWYYGNDTKLNNGYAVTITESMDGASVYCAEIAPCYYGKNSELCTLARSKSYTLHFVKTDEPTLTAVVVKNEGDKERFYSDGNVTTIDFSGDNTYLKCLDINSSMQSDKVSWYDGNNTLLESGRTMLLNKQMDGTTVFCKMRVYNTLSDVVKNLWNVAQSHIYTLRFVDTAPTSTELKAPTTTTPASVCPTLSPKSIRDITYAENAHFNLYIFGQSHNNFNEDYTVNLERDQNVFIQCRPHESQNARIKIYFKKRNEKDFECIDKNETIATNMYDRIVCVNIGDDNIPSFRSAFVLIYNTSVAATSTSEAYRPTTTSLPEGTTSLLEGTTSLPDSEPGKAQPPAILAGIIVVAGVLVLAALVLGFYKWRQNTTKRRTNLVLDDQIYSISGQVQYAELQMKSVSKRIQPKEENCPYAQIIGVMAPES